MAAGCLTLALVTSLSLPLRTPVSSLDPYISLNKCSISPFANRTPQCVSANRFSGLGAGCRRLERAGQTLSVLRAEASQSGTGDEHSSEAANEAISDKAVAELLEKGFTIIDDAIDMKTVDEFLVGAEGMEDNGKLKTIPEQVMLGREDKIMVIDVWNPAWGPIPDNFKGVAAACAMMKGLAIALERRLPQPHPWGKLSAPPFFQLAVYDGVGAKYVRHIDNDPEDPAAQEGPAGLRICDRAVTALLYFNKEEEVLEEIAPRAARLVLFDSKKFFHEVLPSYRRRWALSAWINGAQLD